MTVESEVLKAIVPSKDEQSKLKEIVESFLVKLKKELDDGLKAKAVVAGSYAKDTWLSGVKDVDVFVAFDYKQYKNKSDELSDMISGKLKKFKAERLHGSRDYFQIRYKSILFEIVPVLDIKDPKDAKNITDMSIIHATWVGKHVKDTKQLRLAKAFFKAQRVYGAESYIQGFSGYCIEVLSIKYKTFNNLLKNIAKWKERTIIDIEKHHKNVMFEINKSKLLSPLILVDPVQPGRNVAAALSIENYDKIIKAAKNYLKKPSKEYFEKKELNLTELKAKAKGKKLVIVEGKSLVGKQDVVGCKVLKVFNYLRNKLVLGDFDVVDAGWRWDKKKDFTFWFIVDGDIEKEKEWSGPPVKNKDHADAFKKKHKKSYEKKGKLYAIVEREHTKAERLVGDVLKMDYVKEKVKSVRLKR